MTVNGVEAEAASMSVDPDVDAVLVDGKPVAGELRKVYLKVNKPRGVISTTWDDRGRRTVMSMTPRALRGMKLFPVGRLDAETTGLLLLTNDGELANALMHPRFGVEKEYHVELDGGLSEAEQGALEEGVVINGERTSEAEVNRLVGAGGDLVQHGAEGGQKTADTTDADGGGTNGQVDTEGADTQFAVGSTAGGTGGGAFPEGSAQAEGGFGPRSGGVTPHPFDLARRFFNLPPSGGRGGNGRGMSFTSELQRGVEPLWEKMVTHRFVQELGDGTLPWEKFQRYFEQDYVFLRQGWIHMISLAIAKSPDFASARVLTGFLHDVLDGEEGCFRGRFGRWGCRRRMSTIWRRCRRRTPSQAI